MHSESTDFLETRLASLREELAGIGELRLGSLLHRYRRCGKEGCACSSPEHDGHPCWIISKKVGRKTMMSTVPSTKLLPTVRHQLEEGHHFWRVCREIAEISDELSKRQLRGADQEDRSKSKKRASKNCSTKK